MIVIVVVVIIVCITIVSVVIVIVLCCVSMSKQRDKKTLPSTSTAMTEKQDFGTPEKERYLEDGYAAANGVSGPVANGEKRPSYAYIPDVSEVYNA